MYDTESVDFFTLRGEKSIFLCKFVSHPERNTGGRRQFCAFIHDIEIWKISSEDRRHRIGFASICIRLVRMHTGKVVHYVYISLGVFQSLISDMNRCAPCLLVYIYPLLGAGG